MNRNKELRKPIICLFLITVIATVIGFHICPGAGILAMVSSAAFNAAFFVFTGKRYHRIAELSEMIDQVLHNEEQLLVSDYEEGELAILQNEIIKMTIRIREQNEALQQEKENLSDSLADVAHQLRTPLTAAGLILPLLEQTTNVQDRRLKLRELESLFRQMDWLITALLKLSRLDAGIVSFQTETLAVHKLAEAAMHPLLIPLELHNITVRTTMPEAATVKGDFNWLSEAISNLLKNCMESAGDGGYIELSCEDNILYTQIIIHDSGKGFDEKELPRLFERFYRGRDRETAGYGIGLALCKKIITGQGGTIKAENHPQGGALFTIRFSK